MSLVSLKDILPEAQKNKYAVGAFTVWNMEYVQAVRFNYRQIDWIEQKDPQATMAINWLKNVQAIPCTDNWCRASNFHRCSIIKVKKLKEEER